MKRITSLLLTLTLGLTSYAQGCDKCQHHESNCSSSQENSCCQQANTPADTTDCCSAAPADDEPMTIDNVLSACLAMQQADAEGNTQAMQQAADSLRASNTKAFSSLRCKDEDTTDATLVGHFVFDEAFVDTLMTSGSDYAKDHADELSRSSSHRGQSASGSILTKTCFVKAGKSTKYSFASRGRQELAVVAEAGGLVTMKIHATNSSGLDQWFSDTVDVKKGRPHRKTAFNLPQDKRNTVELEVVNCSGKDITFVVISN